MVQFVHTVLLILFHDETNALREMGARESQPKRIFQCDNEPWGEVNQVMFFIISLVTTEERPPIRDQLLPTNYRYKTATSKAWATLISWLSIFYDKLVVPVGISDIFERIAVFWRQLCQNTWPNFWLNGSIFIFPVAYNYSKIKGLTGGLKFISHITAGLY